MASGSSGPNRSPTEVSNNKITKYKIVVLGDGGVGKSALTLQFVSHRFPESHDATIEDAYQHQAVIDSEPCQFDILDTAGQIEFTAMREQYMRCGEGFLLCFSLTERRSFEEVSDYHRQLLKVRVVDDIPIVLVGNKMDLGASRKVSREEGQALARSIGCPFFEASAALRQYVDDSFYALIREIRRKQRESAGLKENKVGKRSRWKRLTSIIMWLFRKKQ